MLASDPGPLTKFWWKGIDIVANLITGVLLALLALASWRFQQLWARRISERHKRDDELACRRSLVSAFEAKRTNLQSFSKEVFSIAKTGPMGELANQYCEWLEESRLRAYSDNWKRFDELAKWRNHKNIFPNDDVPAQDLVGVERAIMSTQLPSIEDPAFWQ